VKWKESLCSSVADRSECIVRVKKEVHNICDFQWLRVHFDVSEFRGQERLRELRVDIHSMRFWRQAHANSARPQHHAANILSLVLTSASSRLTAMDTPTHSSPRLELRPKRVRSEHAIMDANRLLHEGDYTAALAMYNQLLDERCHPAYYLNRALCFVATDRPHLAVNDALRAYMMAQSVIDALRNNGEVNDHVRRIDAHIITYNGTFRLSSLRDLASGISKKVLVV
jgi:hypothetical protein